MEYKGTKRPMLDEMTDTERKGTPIYDGLMKYFPNALSYGALNSVKGQSQHNGDSDSTTVFWAREKSQDELGSLSRHILDFSIAEAEGDYEGMADATQAIVWRACAHGERFFNPKEGDPERYSKILEMEDSCVVHDEVQVETEGGYKRVKDYPMSAYKFTLGKVYFFNKKGFICDDTGVEVWSRQSLSNSPFHIYFEKV